MRTTKQLVELAKNGDSMAVGELVTRYERAAVTTALTIIGDFHLAQDIAQESFVDAFRQLPKLRRCDAFGVWLLVNVRRKANRKRSQSHDEMNGLELSEILPQPDTWITEFEDLLPMLGRLPTQEADVVNLRYLCDLSVKQIAEHTDRPIGTVTKQLSRAIRRLQEMVAEVQQ